MITPSNCDFYFDDITGIDRNQKEPEPVPKLKFF